MVMAATRDNEPARRTAAALALAHLIGDGRVVR